MSRYQKFTDEQSWSCFSAMSALGSVLGLIALVVASLSLGLLVTWNANNVKTISGVQPHVNGEVSVLAGTAMSETTDDATSQVVLNNAGVWNVTVLHNLTVNGPTGALVLDNTGVRDAYAGLNISISGTYYKTFDNTGVREATAGAGISVTGTYYKTISNTGVLSLTCTGAGMNCTGGTTGNVAIGTSAILTVNGLTPDSNGDTTLSGYYGLIVDNGPGPHGNQVWHELTRRNALPPYDPDNSVLEYVALILNVSANTWRQHITPGFNPTFIPGLFPGDGGAGNVGGMAWQPVYEGLYTLNIMLEYSINIDPQSHQSVTGVVCFDCVDENPFNGFVPIAGGVQSQDVNTGTNAVNGTTVFAPYNSVRFMSFTVTFEVCSLCDVTIGSVLTLHTYHSHTKTNATVIAPIMDSTYYFQIAQVI